MKLIINIPQEAFELLNTTGVDWLGAEHILSAVANGVPLDDIKAEIQENINYNKKMNYQGIVAGLLLTLDILDNIGKAESEDN